MTRRIATAYILVFMLPLLQQGSTVQSCVSAVSLGGYLTGSCGSGAQSLLESCDWMS